MKKIAFATAFLLGLGAAANAQIAFTGMDLTVKGGKSLNAGSPISFYGIDGQAAFSNGVYGVQTDFGYQTARAGGIPASEYDIGLHVFGSFSDSVKFGGFYTIDTFSASGSSIRLATYGGEVLTHFGKLDADFSIAGTKAAGVLSRIRYIATADAYYSFSPAFSANFGVSVLGNSSSNLTLYTIGGRYTLANMPLSFGVDYTKATSSSGSTGSGVITANISYGFGPHSDGRMFGKRNFDYIGMVSTF
jgi:hypothetical protein